jgi:hypothetical protein
MRVGSAGNDERGNQSEGEPMNLLDVCSAEEIRFLLDVGGLTAEQLLEQLGFEWPMREGDELVANTEERCAWKYGMRVWEHSISVRVQSAPTADDIHRWERGTRLCAIVETHEFMAPKTYRGMPTIKRWNQREVDFDAADEKPPAALMNILCHHIAKGKNWKRVR